MSNNEKNPILYHIHSAICIALMIGTGFLPPFGGITTLGMDVLGIFLGVLWGWIFIGFIWPSLLGMIVLGFTSYGSILDVFTAGFGDALVLKIFFMFIFACILDETGLTKFIANWCVSRKSCMGHPWILTLFIFIASIFIGGFINLYGGIVIMWYIFYNICQNIGLKRGDTYTSYVVVGIVYLCTIGALALPFLPMSIIYRGTLKLDILSTMPVPMGTMTLFHVAITVLLLFSYLILGKYVLRVDVTALQKLTPEFYDSLKNNRLDTEQRWGLLALAAFICVLVGPTILPDGQLKAAFANMDIIGMGVLIICFFCFRKTNGKSVYHFSELVSKSINWDLIILFAATVPISAAMESAESGIVNAIVSALIPIFSQINPSMFLIFCLLILIIVTQVAHNIILAIVFTSVIASIGMGMDINPYLTQIMMAFSLQLAFITPGASSSAALIFGNTDWISTKESYKYGSLVVVSGIFVIFCLALPLGFFLF